jgi:hypothetical protein
MKGRSFVLVGVNCDDTIEQAKLVVKNQRISWRSWFDGPRGMTGKVYTRWGVQAVPSVFVLDPRGVIRWHSDGAPQEAVLDKVVDDLLPAGERGRPRWIPPESLRERLGEEVEVGAYRMQAPPGFRLERREPEAGRRVFLWKGPAGAGGTAQLEVVLGPGAKDRPEDAVETALAAVPCLRQGWTCTPAQRGEVNDLTFYRAIWHGLEKEGRQRAHGFEYAGRDGETLIRVSGRGPQLDGGALLLAEAATLTFRKPAK